MKKTLSILWIVILCITLCACGENNTEKANESKQYSIQDLVGKWEDPIKGDILEITDNEISIDFVHADSDVTDTNYSQWTIKGDILSIDNFLYGDLIIEESEDGIALVGKDAVFVVRTDKITFVQVGEVIISDEFEFTVNKVQIAERLYLSGGELYTPNPDGINGGLSAGDGKVYVVLDVTIKNLAKESISPGKLFDAMKINYADGYLYDQGNAAWLGAALPMDGIYMIVPLATEDYRITFKCAADVESGEEELYLDTTLSVDEKEVIFKCKLN